MNSALNGKIPENVGSSVCESNAKRNWVTHRDGGPEHNKSTSAKNKSNLWVLEGPG